MGTVASSLRQVSGACIRQRAEDDELLLRYPSRLWTRILQNDQHVRV